MISLHLDVNENNLQIMHQHRVALAQQGKLQEANYVRKAHKQMTIDLDEKRKHELTQIQLQELMFLENEYKIELKKFKLLWKNVILPDFYNSTALVENELRKRQAKELEEFQSNILGQLNQESNPKQRFHYSQEIIQLCVKYETFIEAGLYAEARPVKKQIKQLKEIEEAKQKKNHRKTLAVKSTQIEMRHDKELRQMISRHAQTKLELLQRREEERKLLDTKYQNKWQNIENIHRRQKNQYEKYSLVKKMKLHMIHKGPVYNQGKKTILDQPNITLVRFKT